MRRLVVALMAASLIAAPMAQAAPCCWDKAGNPIRCGAPGAMPVGWSPSPQQRLNRDLANPIGANVNQLLKAAYILGLFLAMIALMPEFDGTRAEDWDERDDRG